MNAHNINDEARAHRAELIAQLTARVGDDGTGDLAVIVDSAVNGETVEDLVAIVLEARAEAAGETE